MTEDKASKETACAPQCSTNLEEIYANVAVSDVLPLLKDLYSRGSYEAGYEVARARFERWSMDPSFLRTYRALVTKLGMLSEATYATYLLHGLRRTSGHSLRHVEGSLREISGWRPSITGPPVQIEPENTKRILHLVKESRPQFSNGFTSRSHYNFKAEQRAGLQPIIMTEPGAARPPDGTLTPRIERFDGVIHHHLDLAGVDFSQMPRDDYLDLFCELAFERVKEIRPALIHASSGRRGYETATVAAALSSHTGLPMVYEVRSFFEANWTDDVTREESGEIFERRMELELQMLRRADLVLTIGQAMRDNLISRGVDADRIGVVPNGVDTTAFYPEPRDVQLASEYGIDEGTVTFGYVSNMDHYRESQETLIKALGEMPRLLQPVKCVLVGDGPRRSQMEDLAESLGVRDDVVFTGRVDHGMIRKYYGLIDIFVVPRTSERAATYVTPLKPFEAMGMRKPIIVSDLPALSEIADPPNRGLVYPVGDHVELAGLIATLVKNPELRSRLAESALDWVTTERTWGHNGERYATYFASLTGE